MTTSLHSTTKPLVLVVDDDHAARLLTCEALQQSGLAVVEAENGRQALEVFEAQRPDMLLLDVEMPALDGFATCTALRKLPHGAHVPVLMVTGLDDVPSIQRAFDAGATDFVTKPLNWLLLGHRVRYMLRASTAANALRRSEEKNRALLRAIPDMMFRLTEDGILVDFKGARGFKRLVSKGKIRGNMLRSVVPAAVARRAQEKIGDAVRTGQPQLFEYEMVLADGNHHFEARLVTCGEGEVLAIVRDITERKQSEERIRLLAYYDELTTLPNRQFFNETLSHMLDVARRYRRLAAVLFLDVDRFKRINDTLGHRAGDLLLQAVAARITLAVRNSDVVSRIKTHDGGHSIARLGGDEFTVLLNEVSRVEDAALAARRILECFVEPFTIDGHQVYTTCSIGIAVFPADGEDADTLLKNADTAMYHAKETGRNNYQFYSESMNATALERLSLETMLRHAVERDELRLYYQPQVDLRTGEVSGVEALVRWHHPDLGLVSPGAFIPLAEETGLIVPIGEWVLRTACAQNKAWQVAGLRPMRMAVNLSAQQFREGGLKKMIEAVLAETGLAPEYLEIEITESTVMANAEQTIATLSELKAMGIALAVDDFGTGYSSLAYLKRFPLDTLKIDRAFVRDLAEDADDAAIATAILALAHTLHLDVVAEGVETHAQLDFLRAHGCEGVQGYLFARPTPPEEIVTTLAETAELLQRLCVLPAGR